MQGCRLQRDSNQKIEDDSVIFHIVLHLKPIVFLMPITCLLLQSVEEPAKVLFDPDVFVCLDCDVPPADKDEVVLPSLLVVVVLLSVEFFDDKLDIMLSQKSCL